MNAQATIKLLIAVSAMLAIILAGCERAPATPAEHTHDPQPTRPAVQTHSITVRSSDFLNDTAGLALAGYAVSALTKRVVESGEIHAYLKVRGFDSWDQMPVTLVAGTASVTLRVSYDEGSVYFVVIGTVVNRRVLDIFFPATLRLVIDQGTAS